MKSIVSKYTLQLAGLTVLLGVLTLGFRLMFTQIPVTAAYPYLLVFLFVFFWLTFFAVAKSMQKKITRFANTYMIVNFLKLVVFSLFLLGYAYLHKKEAAPFIITFFVYYIFYSILEVIGLKTLNTEMKK